MYIHQKRWTSSIAFVGAMTWTVAPMMTLAATL